MERKRTLGVLYQWKLSSPWPRGARPSLGQLAAELPVGEVGEADDAPPAHAQHVGEHARHVHHGLQRLREDDEVELPVGEGRQALVQVGLDHVQPAADAGQDRLLVQFDAHDPLDGRARASRASSPPVPQPRSSTLAPGGISSRIES